MTLPSTEGRSRIMRAVRSKNTKPEIAVRKLLHAMGYRFRLHRPDLPGKPDIVLSKHNAAIFVHGCFWHQHADPGCRNGRKPQSNTSYWTPKLARNIERDREAAERLEALGWRVLVAWECRTTNTAELERMLRSFLDRNYE